MVYTKSSKIQAGFTAVELMITIIIAAIFISAFYELYVSINRVNAESKWLVAANQAAYAKPQAYEDKPFEELITENPDPTDLSRNCMQGATIIGYKDNPDFTDEITGRVLGPTTAVVCIGAISPTLKTIDVKVTYGGGGKVIEYNSYVQYGGDDNG